MDQGRTRKEACGDKVWLETHFSKDGDDKSMKENRSEKNTRKEVKKKHIHEKKRQTCLARRRTEQI